MMNVMEDWSKMPQPKPKANPKAKSKENQPPKEEDVKVKEATGKDGPGDKRTLKSWLTTMDKGASI